MEYLIVAIIVIIIIIIARYIFDFNVKKIKQIIKNEKLDKITSKYPDNIEICKWYLKKLNNETVEIEENTSKESCLYIAITNKILIANIKNSYSRIQTIAHECLHSIQGKKMLLFNFVFSNIYLLYFFIICLLGIFGILPNKEMFLSILAIFGILYLTIRNYSKPTKNSKACRGEYINNDILVMVRT